MRNSTRLKRLNMLSDMLHNHKQYFKETKFNMNLWYSKSSTKYCEKNSSFEPCGTAACALGSAAVFVPFKKMGLKLGADHWDFSGDSEEVEKDVPTYKDEQGFEAGALFFGISEDESTNLFDPCYYDQEKIRPKTVASRVDKLIKRYENGKGDEQTEFLAVNS